MSRPATRERTDEPRGGTRYEDDLYTWVQEQVALLQAGHVTEIDAQNIAEELGDVGRSEYRELQSALTLILTHMLKWDHQPEKRTRSWDNTIATQRKIYADVLEDNPGLKPRGDEALLRAYDRARLEASSETGLAAKLFPPECPYDWDEILTRDFDFDSLGEQR